jgi:1-acyl-sn-glycerol-3-phosphate acyltransferase
MTETYQLPRGQKLKRILLRALVKTVMSILFRIRITGKENIPVGTAYMIAANHVSHFEPPLILAFWPEYPEAVAGHDVWERGINGKFVSTYGAIPVKRGEYDRKVLEEMIAILRSGRSLMISPEGGRSHTPGMRRALPGVAYVVNKTHVPVLPVAIVGTRNDSLKKSLRLGRPVLEMRIGEPFMLPEISGKGEERRAARQQAADEVMLRIAAMLPEEYHGVYTGQVENFPDD